MAVRGELLHLMQICSLVWTQKELLKQKKSFNLSSESSKSISGSEKKGALYSIPK